MADEKKDGKSVTVEALDAVAKMASEACGRIRKLEAWLKEKGGIDVDLDGDGKVGYIRSALAGFVLMSAIVGIVFAATYGPVDFMDEAVFGTAQVEGDDSTQQGILRADDLIAEDDLTVGDDATITGDLTAATVAGAMTGDITCDDITASGADTASLDLNIPASTNAQMGTITVKSATAVANMDDNDYVRYILLNAYDSATAACNYAYMDVEADDVTTDSQDGSIDFYVEINSTATKVLDLSASGAEFGTLQVLSTAADLGDGDLTNVGAISCDSIGADGTAVAINTGTGEVTLDGKYATVGPDATTGLMVLGASITATGTTMTNTFATTFGAAPIVTLTYTEDPGTATNSLYLGTITASNFISFHVSSKNYSYIAVGQRP
jgi:hypothetical protein